MRFISTWCLAVAATVLCGFAVAERLEDDSLSRLHFTDLGNPTRLAGNDQGEPAGVLPRVKDWRHNRPLRAAEIAKRLGIDQRVLVSTWDAGFPKTMKWVPENVVDDGAGGVALLLSLAQENEGRPYLGGQFKAKDYVTVWGRVEWQGKLPVGIPGSVVGLFLYKTPFTAKTDREFDLEYVPGDPNVTHEHGTMQMTLHMKRHDGAGRKEAPSYRINIPAQCVEAVCGWAIEFQPRDIVFQIDLNQGNEWETIGHFKHGAGWDLNAGAKYDGALNGKTINFSSDEIWSEQAVKAIACYWVTNDQIGWLGALDEADLIGDVPRFEIKSMTPLAYDTLSPFRPDDWSVAANGELTIANIPNDGLQLTGLQYRLDGGDWLGLNTSTVGTYTLPTGPAVGQSIEIRSVARGPAFADSGYQVTSDPSEANIVPAL